MQANIFIILTILFFGVGTFLGKFALKDMSSVHVYFLEALGTLTIALSVAFFFRKDLVNIFSNFNWAGYLFGILWGLGTVTFIFALKYETASIVVPLTALHPLITILLAVLFLGEAITLRTGAGIFMAMGAVILLLT